MEKLKENLDLLHKEVAAPNRRIGFAIVPSKPAIYADRLPPDTPTDIRRNFQQVMKGRHLFNGITPSDMARFRAYIEKYDPDDIIFVFHGGGLFEWIINRMVQSWALIIEK